MHEWFSSRWFFFFSSSLCSLHFSIAFFSFFSSHVILFSSLLFVFFFWSSDTWNLNISKRKIARENKTHIIYIMSAYMYIVSMSVYKVNISMYCSATIFSSCFPLSFFAFISQLLCLHFARCCRCCFWCCLLLLAFWISFFSRFIWFFLLLFSSRFHGWIAKHFSIQFTSFPNVDFLHPLTPFSKTEQISTRTK